MKTFVLASVTLGLALAGPAAGSSAASNPLRSDPMAFHKVLGPRQAVDSRAVAYAHPTLFPMFGRSASPSIIYDSSGHEADGLSRNPDDCVRWGCVDNN
ncbi:MAG: hypothetical protein JO223_18440 [Hyphomicrobiales bacterium]|nr:hypothetical protein [Hyphomicrobiales bacterium]